MATLIDDLILLFYMLLFLNFLQKGSSLWKINYPRHNNVIVGVICLQVKDMIKAIGMYIGFVVFIM